MIGNPNVAVTSSQVGADEIDFLIKVTNLYTGDVVTILPAVAVNSDIESVLATATVAAVPPPPTPSPTPPPVPPVTFDQNTALVLSADHLTVSCPLSGKFTAKASVAKSAGKWLAGFKAVIDGPNFAFGLINAKFPAQYYLGSEPNSVGFYPTTPTAGTFWINNHIVPSPGQPGYPPGGAVKGVAGDLDLLAWDADGKFVRVQTPQMVALLGPNAWNWVANAWNPTTGLFTTSSGLDVSSLGSELWMVLGLADIGSSGSLVLTGLPVMASYTVLSGPTT